MCNKGFPKSYQKLMDDYIKYVTDGDIWTNENDDVWKQSNLSYEEKKSWQFIADEFIMHISGHTLIVNTRLVNEVMLIMNKNFENDYEMSDTKISKISQPPKSHLLAIENIVYDSESSEYVSPITHCTIEEMN